MGQCLWVLVVCIDGASAMMIMGLRGVFDGSGGMVVVDGLRVAGLLMDCWVVSGC